MSHQSARDTGAEMALRRELHRRGLRYRVHVRPEPGIRAEADVLFTRVRVAVMVDGCFWHGCPIHATWPKSNADWWRVKIESNQARDRRTDQALTEAGWTVLRVWEHEAVQPAADRVAGAVASARSPLPLLRCGSPDLTVG